MVMELVKTPKGNKYLYEVKDGNGQVLATRISSRSYVAATANGEFFFGRKSLVGKGNHAKVLRELENSLSYGPKEWEKKRREYIRLYGEKIANKYFNPANMVEDIEEEHKYARNHWDGYTKIAYLAE